jgi:proton glutamate symport protein
MNPCVAILERAIEKAAAINAEDRAAVYDRARKSVDRHFSAARAPISDSDYDLVTRNLEDAITIIEARSTPEDRPGQGTSDPRNPAGGGRATARGSARFALSFPIFGAGPSRTRLPTPPEAPIMTIRPRATLFAAAGAGMRFLSNPWVLFASLLLGVYIGISDRNTAFLLSPIADLYIELLKMVLIPFMISAIVMSLSRLFGSETMNRHLPRILTVFVVSTTAVAILGVVSAVVLSPGENISDSSRQTLGQLINRSPYAVDLEIALDDANAHPKEIPSDPMIMRLIPDNIFQALTVGDNLKILFFAIAFGVGLGSLRLRKGDGLLAPLVSVYEICTQIIGWVNLLLPLAVCAMVAKQVATVGAAQLLAMLRFTVGFGVAATAICLLSVVAIAVFSGAGVGATLKAIRQPVLVAIATRSSIACIPTTMSALITGLGYDRSQIELMIPLGITLFRFGPILYYAFSTIFVAQLYDVHSSFAICALIVLGSVLTGLASAGTTGVLTISLLGVIFQPLGLPLEAALALLVTIDPVIDIFRTVAIVLPNCATAAFIYRNKGGRSRVDGAPPEPQPIAENGEILGSAAREGAV